MTSQLEPAYAQSTGLVDGRVVDTCRINDNFCSLLESGPKPTVAAVEALALGGGLETALACNARICTPGAQPVSLQLYCIRAKPPGA